MDEKDMQQTEPETPNLEDTAEFDLDAIMKEFASRSEETPAGEEIPESPEEETPSEEAAPAEEAPVEAIPGTVTGDTIRLDRLEIGQAAPPVKNAVPITEEEEPQEAFSGQWEPEYEQPMGSYVPPQPIVFLPRSRLRELKRKIVAGPEKRYYNLMEKGVGKLQAAIFLSVLVVLLSAGATAMYAFGMVQDDRLRLMIFGQFLAMLVSALLGSFQLIEGVTDLIKGRFTLKTLMVFTFLVCCVDAILCLQQLRVPCCAAFSLEMTMALCNTYQRRITEIGQMDTLRKASQLGSIRSCKDYYNGRKGYLRGDGEVEDFMDHYQEVSGPEKALSWYALFALAAAAVIGIVAGVFHGGSAGIQVAAVTLLAAAPASIFITLSRPQAILTRRLHNVGALICGWRGVEGLRGKAVIPIGYQDLFAPGAARMNGVKFYGSRQPDEVVAYCTAVVVANDSGLAPVFSQVLDSRNGYHYDAVDLRCYDNGGIGAEVNAEPVLVGSVSFLKEMGVEIPDGIRVNQAVCVAIDGELCGLFALSYENNRYSAVGLASLCGSRHTRPILATDDFLLTMPFLRSRFSINPKRILIPEHSHRAALRDKTPEEDAPALALTTRENLAAYATCICGAKALRTASYLGTAVHILSGVLGVATMVILTLLGRLDLLTPANVLAYQLIWMIPGLLLTEWTRTG